jgi:hypothetical protein
MAPSVNDMDQTLSDRLRAVLEQFPDLVGDSVTLARRLAPALGNAGLLSNANGSADAPTKTSRSKADPLEMRVLAAVLQHPSGQNPGIAPEALAHLTGLSGAALARAVSALVQSGALIRDAWLVRVPQADDLMPMQRPERAATLYQEAAMDQRAIGDRRAVGERRLYDRRMSP